MQTKTLTRILGVLLLGSMLQPANAGAINCWVNKLGVRECGSIIPPEYAKQEHEVRNRQGEVVQEVQAEMSEAERRAIREKEKAEEEAKRLAEVQEKEDMALLDAYPTASDILVACNGKVASIKAAVDVANNQVKFYAKSLKDAEELRDRTEKPSEELLLHIKNLKRQLAGFERTIADKYKEKDAIIQQHQEHLYRYQQVKRRLSKEYSSVKVQTSAEVADNDCNLQFRTFDDLPADAPPSSDAAPAAGQ